MKFKLFIILILFSCHSNNSFMTALTGEKYNVSRYLNTNYYRPVYCNGNIVKMIKLNQSDLNVIGSNAVIDVNQIGNEAYLYSYIVIEGLSDVYKILDREFWVYLVVSPNSETRILKDDPVTCESGWYAPEPTH